MNNPFRYRPSAQMAAMAWEVVKAISTDPALHDAFSSGKMLGLLRHSHGWAIAYSGKRVAALEGIFLPSSVFHTGIPGASSTASSTVSTAFSGAAAESALDAADAGVGRAEAIFMQFVPPIYDITVGPFKEKEAEISHLNHLIAQAQGAAGGLKPAEAVASQEEIEQMKLRRSLESIKLQKWTFEQYSVLNARGERKSVLDIFAEKGILPPAATGDCAAPKLLQFAYLNDLEPLEIGEFWYGAPPIGSVRAQGRFYPACSWKCGPLLQYMLQGQDVASAVTCHGTPSVLYEDDSLVVVNKPSGMPAVPGLDGLESLESWLRQRPAAADAASVSVAADAVAATAPAATSVAAGASVAAGNLAEGIFQVHRLDQDTSGLMVFAKTRRAQSALQRQFQDHTVVKAYIAVLSATGTVAGTTYRPASETTAAGTANRTAAGNIPGTAPGTTGPGTAVSGTPQGVFGTIDFPLGPDYEDKPRQKHDPTQGKPAVTQYRFLTGPDATRALSLFGLSSSASEYAPVLFLPQTGRSHQLRVHSAHALGLGAPILGDTLYGGDTLRGSTNSCGDTLPQLSTAQPASGSSPKAGSPSVIPQRLCLHASYLSFTHPLTGETLHFGWLPTHTK